MPHIINALSFAESRLEKSVVESMMSRLFVRFIVVNFCRHLLAGPSETSKAVCYSTYFPLED
jgi:hypothetical protein